MLGLIPPAVRTLSPWLCSELEDVVTRAFVAESSGMLSCEAACLTRAAAHLEQALEALPDGTGVEGAVLFNGFRALRRDAARLLREARYLGPHADVRSTYREVRSRAS